MKSRELALGGEHFWARGYSVSTVGRDEKAIRRQEEEDRRLDQMKMFD